MLKYTLSNIKGLSIISSTYIDAFESANICFVLWMVDNDNGIYMCMCIWMHIYISQANTFPLTWKNSMQCSARLSRTHSRGKTRANPAPSRAYTVQSCSRDCLHACAVVAIHGRMGTRAPHDSRCMYYRIVPHIHFGVTISGKGGHSSPIAKDKQNRHSNYICLCKQWTTLFVF